MIEPRCTHRGRRQGRTTGLPPSRVVRPVATVLAILCTSTPVDAAPPATIRHTESATSRQVRVDLASTSRRDRDEKMSKALAQLRQFGYVTNTPARADRAIRHWQNANGLTVDGIIGPATLSSLNLPQISTPAPAPAVRLTPPLAPPATDVESIIRAAWPDDLEDRALAIAYRESRLQPGARNSCCYGLFQIHWAAHRAWLADIGITNADQLLDAATNANAAYALFQRDGWAPWSL